MPMRIAVVVSQGQSSNPAKRKLEEDLITALMIEPGIEVTIVPHLYDIQSDSTAHLALHSISSNLVVFSWLYERAAHWVLDRAGIKGKIGTVLLRLEGDDDDEDEEEASEEVASFSPKANGKPIPNRFKYCLDLRVTNNVQEYVSEVQRIRKENETTLVSPSGSSAQLPIVVSSPPKSAPNGKANDARTLGEHSLPSTGLPFQIGENGTLSLAPSVLNRIEEETPRRWYPVIDFGRCTNCMECIDFCLFGVYGVDPMEQILVEQPDNCRKGCPACSRVCPENAIMFPQHKTPAIAGANEAAESMKIDLSQLFGAPAESKSAIDVAAAERDEQLLMAGRDAVGLSVGIPKRQTQTTDEPRTKIDDLVDQLDELDL